MNPKRWASDKGLKLKVIWNTWFMRHKAVEVRTVCPYHVEPPLLKVANGKAEKTLIVDLWEKSFECSHCKASGKLEQMRFLLRKVKK